ncbi:hypothetical protein ACERZ8_02575 [Tateyamaria armeniaca]|uniref:Uncharacterized protein n=1 Tax=Tateyamaria armeniaca TaxID=2518930 RepID=A0ABW8UUE4_9RHOB
MPESGCSVIQIGIRPCRARRIFQRQRLTTQRDLIVQQMFDARAYDFTRL